MGKDKKLYNYIVNTLGVSKKIVMEYVGLRVPDLLTKHIKEKIDSKAVEGMILQRVTECVVDGIPTSKFTPWQRTDFDEYLKKCIQEVIKNRLNEEYELQVKMVKKDAAIVHRSI